MSKFEIVKQRLKSVLLNNDLQSYILQSNTLICVYAYHGKGMLHDETFREISYNEKSGLLLNWLICGELVVEVVKESFLQIHYAILKPEYYTYTYES